MYVSRYPLSLGPLEISAIVEKSLISNERNGVTGILLSKAGYFLQLIEGERFDVSYTFKKIRDDRRHSRVQLLSDGSAKHRFFERWAMDYRDVDSANPEVGLLVRNILEATDQGKDISAPDLLSLLSRFSRA